MRKLLLAVVCSAASLLAGTSVPAQIDMPMLCPCGVDNVVCCTTLGSSLSTTPWKFAVGRAPLAALITDSDITPALTFTPEDKTMPSLSIGRQSLKDVIMLYDVTNDKTLAVIIEGHLYIAAGETAEHVLQVVLQTVGIVNGKISVHP